MVGPLTATQNPPGPGGSSRVEFAFVIDAPMPTFDGQPLASPLAPSGKYVVQQRAGLATFSYSAVLCRTQGPGSLEVSNGVSWVPAATFDFRTPAVNATDLALDQVNGRWIGMVVLPLKTYTAAGFMTDPTTGFPRYGFLGVVRSPKVNSTAAATSTVPSTPVGVVRTADAAPIGLQALIGLSPTDDVSSANGLELYVRGLGGAHAAHLLLSNDPSVQPPVQLELAGGPSVGLKWGNDISVAAAGKVMVNTPLLTTSHDLHADHRVTSPGGSL